MSVGDANRINTNLSALNALNSLMDVNRSLQISQLRLSTGKRINEAADDPSGYSISTQFDQRARGLSVALDSVGTASNVLSIAEGSLNNINQILLNMRDLVVSGASDTMGATERAAINTQLSSLRAEIDRIASQTSFNGTKLLDGAFTNKRFQTGDTETDYISFSITSNFNSTSIGLASASVDSSTTACNSLASVNAAITIVTGQVQSIGSTVQRLRLVETNLTVAITNTTSAKSRILDADVAKEQVESTRLQIMRQLATAQLAQSNVAPQNVLSLFR
ncbi:MAG TPA: flagellin [Candidatus Methylomirabilis sp.]|nr:flagellin [Candidatus Methylomirabilis sp.]